MPLFFCSCLWMAFGTIFFLTGTSRNSPYYYSMAFGYSCQPYNHELQKNLVTNSLQKFSSRTNQAFACILGTGKSARARSSSRHWAARLGKADVHASCYTLKFLSHLENPEAVHRSWRRCSSGFMVRPLGQHIVNFKTSYFSAASTATQIGCEHSTKWPGYLSEKTGPCHKFSSLPSPECDLSTFKRISDILSHLFLRTPSRPPVKVLSHGYSPSAPHLLGWARSLGAHAEQLLMGWSWLLVL